MFLFVCLFFLSPFSPFFPVARTPDLTHAMCKRHTSCFRHDASFIFHSSFPPSPAALADIQKLLVPKYKILTEDCLSHVSDPGAIADAFGCARTVFIFLNTKAVESLCNAHLSSSMESPTEVLYLMKMESALFHSRQKISNLIIICEDDEAKVKQTARRQLADFMPFSNNSMKIFTVAGKNLIKQPV